MHLNKFFPSRYPIMCAIMNGVSDLPLAIACHAAGIMPGLMVPWRNLDKKHNFDLLYCTVKEFIKYTGSSDIVLQTEYTDLSNFRFIKMLTDLKISHIELFKTLDKDIDGTIFKNVISTPANRAALQHIRINTKIIDRIFLPTPANEWFQSYALKGKESAGMTGSYSVSEMFAKQKLLSPTLPLITYGGVGTANDVAYYINQGAAAVAIGTLFAVSTESCLSITTKEAMINSKSSDLIKFSKTEQNALLLGDQTIIDPGIRKNSEESLELGIHTGTTGHVYAGTAIDHVTSIRSVQTIVDDLVRYIHV